MASKLLISLCSRDLCSGLALKEKSSRNICCINELINKVMAKATQEKAKRKVSKIYYILIDRKRPVRKRETFLFARIHPFENLKRWSPGKP